MHTENKIKRGFGNEINTSQTPSYYVQLVVAWAILIPLLVLLVVFATLRARDWCGSSAKAFAEAVDIRDDADTSWGLVFSEADEEDDIGLELSQNQRASRGNQGRRKGKWGEMQGDETALI